MTPPSSGALRYLRAGSLAVAMLGLSLMAHVMAGGRAPSTGVVAALALGVFWACTLLTWRRLGRVSLTTAVLASQVLLHKTFEGVAGSGPCVELVHAHAGHLTAGAKVVCSAPLPQIATSHAMPGMVGMPGMGMVVAHAVAAVLTGLLLAGGETALWFLAGLVWRPIAGAAEAALPFLRGRVAIECLVLPRLSLASGGVGRRGPPGGSPASG